MKEQLLNEPHEKYLSKNEFISSSGLKKFMESPLHYKLNLESEDEEEKRHFVIGRAIHTMILEPKKFDKQFCCYKDQEKPFPGEDYRNKANKAFKDSFFARAKDNNLTVLAENELQAVKCASENVKNDKDIQKILSGGETEVSMYLKDEKTGLSVKLRPDYLRYPIIPDLKTCVCSQAEAFSANARKFRYDIQGAFYLKYVSQFEGREYRKFLNIAIEKKAPFIPNIFQYDEEYIEQATIEVEMYMDLFKFCKNNDIWPDHSRFKILENLHEIGTDLNEYFDIIESEPHRRINILSMPGWMKRRGVIY